MDNTNKFKCGILVCIIISIICVCYTGCKHKEISDCSFQRPSVAAYFCIPEHMGSCLPLVIVNTSNGWNAHYGGSASKSFIELRTKGCDDEEHAMIFDEYIDGKLTGHYSLSRFVEFNNLYYCKINSSDTISFYYTPLYDISIINRENIEPDDDLYYDECQFDCQRALYQAYCSPSRTLKKGIEFYGDQDYYESVVSPNKKVRLSSAFYRTLGNGHGHLWQYIILQYDDGDGVTTLCNFIDPYLRDLLGDTIHMNYGHLNDFHIHQINLHGKEYYLIESTPFDELSSPLSEDVPYEYFTNYWSAIAAYQIHKGKFCPAPIFNGKNSYFVVADDATTDMHFKIDSKRGLVLVPHVSTIDYKFSGQYDTIRLK